MLTTIKVYLDGYTYIKEVSFLKADKTSGQAPYGEHDDSETTPLCIPESHFGHDHVELQTHFFFERRNCKFLLHVTRKEPVFEVNIIDVDNVDVRAKRPGYQLQLLVLILDFSDQVCTLLIHGLK